MAVIKNGVQEYIPYVLPCRMPKGMEACCWCPAVRWDRDRNGYRCNVSQEILMIDIKKYVGRECPLQEVKPDGNKGEDLSEVESIANGVKGPEGTI